MEWIWRVQNDESETDLSVLWTHVTGGDAWHRKRFAEAWLDHSGLETWGEAFARGGAAGWEGFKEGITFGGYQAPDWAWETEGFGISRGIGQATAIFELSAATAGVGQALGAGLARAGTAAAATGMAATGGAAGVSGRGGIPGGLRGTWGRAETIADHFQRHGVGVGARNQAEYVEMASQFLRRSQLERLPTKIDPQGIIRVYDPKTNLFGAYNPSGTTATFFKPTAGEAYWMRQPGVAPWEP
jgi:hypothetical protein